MSKKRIYIILCSLLLCLTVFAVLQPFSVSNTAIAEEPEEPTYFQPTQNYIISLPDSVPSTLQNVSITNLSFNCCYDGLTYDTIFIQFDGSQYDIFFDGRDRDDLHVCNVFYTEDSGWVYSSGFDPYNYLITIHFGELDITSLYGEAYNSFIRSIFVETDYNVAFIQNLYNFQFTNGGGVVSNPLFLAEVVYFIDDDNYLNNIAYLYLYDLYHRFSPIDDSGNSIWRSTYDIEGSWTYSTSVKCLFNYIPSYMTNTAFDNSNYIYDATYENASFNGISYLGFNLQGFGWFYMSKVGGNGVASVYHNRFIVHIGNNVPVERLIFENFQDAYNSAKDEWYQRGLDVGYQKGITEEFGEITPWSHIVNAVNSFMSIRIGNIYLSDLISIGLGLILLTLLLRFIL